MADARKKNTAAAKGSGHTTGDIGLPSLGNMIMLMVPLLAVAFSMFYLLAEFRGDEAIHNQRIGLCIFVTLVNAGVLYYYFTTPPHPKFLMLRKRRISMRVHIFFGLTELFAGIIGFFMADQTIAARVMVSAAYIHMVSAAYQTTIVFGEKGFMVPGYMITILLHFYCALRLTMEPTSLLWLINTYLVLNMYAMVRLFYMAFALLGAFPDSLYSVSIILAGMILAPAILGPAGNLFVIGFLFVYLGLYVLIRRPTREEFARMMTERSVNHVFDSGTRELWVLETIENSPEFDPKIRYTDRELARLAFDVLDADSSGSLDREEVSLILARWQTSDKLVKTFLQLTQKEAAIDFDTFYEQIWNFGGIRARFEEGAKASKDVSNKEKARTVFDRLDLDSSGTINRLELHLLLVEWGLPANEVDAYFDEFDDGDGRFSFEEFFKHFTPIWSYGFQEMVRSKKKAARLQPTHNRPMTPGSFYSRNIGGSSSASEEE